MDTKIVAIIPARGGSKGIPKKNVVLVGDKPLIAHSILFSKKMAEIEKTIVSTDDEEIAKISKEFGAEVIMRPKELAQDDSPTIDSLKHVLDNLDNNFAYIVILLQPTSPIRSEKTVKKMLELFNKNKATTMTVVKNSNPRMGHMKSGEYFPLNYEIGQRRQDITDVYQENGNTYILHSENIKRGKLFSGKINHYEISEEESIDIDTYFDLKIVECLLKNETRN